MNQFEKTEKIVAEKADSLLAGKPIWFWWGGYTLLTAVLFGLFYLLFFVLTVKWWIAVLIVVIIGLIWGTIAYTNKKSTQKPPEPKA